MNRTQALCKAFGWQGGTIHQVAKETGCSVSDLLYKTDVDRTSYSSDYHYGWFAGTSCSVAFNIANNFPQRKGNITFWVGVAEGIMVDDGATVR